MCSAVPSLYNLYRSPCAVQYRYSYHILTKFGFSQQIFEKYYKITFRKNPSSGSQVVPCVRPDGQTDVTKLTFAFRKCANATWNGNPLLFFTLNCDVYRIPIFNINDIQVRVQILQAVMSVTAW